MKNETKLTTSQHNQLRKTWENIVAFYYEELCNIHAKLFFQSAEEIAPFKKNTRGNVHEEFIQSLRRGLQKFSGLVEEQDTILLLEKSIDVYKNQMDKGKILNLISLPGSKISAEGFIKNVELAFLTTEEVSPQYAGLLDVIASALQGTTIAIPQWLDIRGDQIASSIENSLRDILKLIYQARLKYASSNAAQTAYKESIMSLYAEISEVEKHIWLPMRPPLTAPLDGEYINTVYARSEDMARRLAQQMVKSDGIILISGYRGVGKSTFLNAALSKYVPEAQENQLEDVKAKIVRVQINVAKASNIENVLRLCIRELHRVKRDHPNIPFSDNERLMIDMANLRTTFRVNVSQGEMLSHAKEIKAAFGFDPGTIFSKLLSPITLPSFLPTFNLTKTSAWQNKFDKSISLLDYDEDRAEEDLIHLVEQTLTPRKDDATGEMVRLKLVFVFDELDKIPAPKQNQIVSRLKNLFLTPNCVFVLVTSKDFYYLLEEEKKKEDSLLGSYFSAVVTVPLFSANETENLIRNLVAIPIPTEEQIKKDTSLIRYQKFHDHLRRLAKYLTYQSFGLPREIVRTLRENQQWTDVGLQPYITDLTFDRDEVRIFGKMQDVIEQVLTSESSLVEDISEDPLSSESELWLNDIRREQVRRGLYVLLDELRLQTVLEVDMQQEMSSKETTLKKIYGNNFKGLPYNSFISVVQNFGRKLAETSDEEGVLFYYEKFDGSSENFRIKVSNKFYKATNTQPSRSELDNFETKELTPDESLQKVRNWLEKETETSSINLLLLYLKRCEKPLPLDVQKEIYRVMTSSSEDLEPRAQLAGYVFVEDILGKNELDEDVFFWISKEKSETIVNAALDWATSSKKKLSSGARISILRNILLRPKNPPSTLTRSINALSNLAAEEKSELPENVLSDVVFSLDKGADIPKELLGSLIAIAISVSDHLIDVLIINGFSSISIETFQTILREQPYPDIETLWKNTAPNSVTTQRLLSALLLHYTGSNETPIFIQEWLNQTQWTKDDLAVLREVGNTNKRFLNSLRSTVTSKQKDTLLDAAIAEIRASTAQPSVKKAPSPSTPPAEKEEVSNSTIFPLAVSAVIGIAILVSVYMLQSDVNTSATVFTRIFTRTVEIFYLLLYAFTVILAFFGFALVRDMDKRSASIGLFVLAGITGSIASLAFWWRYASADAPLTFRGQLSVLGWTLVAIVAPLFSYVILEVIMRFFRRRKK